LSKYDIDLNSILVKPVYIGLAMNVFIPVLILLIAYFVDQPDISRRTINFGELPVLFWALVAVSVADAVMAVYMRNRLFKSPMISSKETFVDDLAKRTFTQTIICTAMTTAIALYGLVYYFVGGTFDHLLLFVFLSFIAYQLIRPRHGFMQKVVEIQERYVDEGRFLERRDFINH